MTRKFNLLRRFFIAIVALCLATSVSQAEISTNAGKQYLMNQAKDLSADFSDFGSTYFFADSLSTFDATSGKGLLKWNRYSLEPRQAFNLNTIVMDRLEMKDFPSSGYYNDPELPIEISFVDDRTIRIRVKTTDIPSKANKDEESPMLAGEIPSVKWAVSEDGEKVTYSSSAGRLIIKKHPWQLIIQDSSSRELTRTRILDDNELSQVKLMPFGFVKRGSDNSRSINPVFSLKAA